MPANPNATWLELVLLTQTVIQGLKLVYGPDGTPLPNQQVLALKMATDGFRLPSTAIAYPCVQCSLGRLEDVANRLQTMEDTTTGLPVQVSILFATNQAFALNNDLLYWRQQIFDAFEDFPDALAAAAKETITDANVWDCQIATQPVLDIAVWQKENLDFAWLILNYAVTRSRGRS